MDSIKTLRARAVLLAQEAADLANCKEVVWARIAFTFLFSLTLLVGAIEPAWAAGDAGATLAQGFRNLFYGVWGFVIGVGIFLAAVYAYLNRGVGAGLMVVAVGLFFFLIPAFVDSAQKFGRSQSSTGVAAQ